MFTNNVSEHVSSGATQTLSVKNCDPKNERREGERGEDFILIPFKDECAIRECPVSSPHQAAVRNP